MNFRDKLFYQSALLVLICVTGFIFPSFITYIFILGALVGVIGIGYWIWKSKKAKKKNDPDVPF